MSCVWTNKVNCVEECVGDTRQASIFLEGAWSADVNSLTITDSSLISHINEILDHYGTVSIVVWWYFWELSTEGIEDYFNISLAYGVTIPTVDVTPVSVGYSTIDNSMIQSWTTFTKTVPYEYLSNIALQIPITGTGDPVCEFAGGFYDVSLYAGGYTPFSRYDSDPNIPAGLGIDMVKETPFYLNPLMSWCE